jgi:hypothetical protein
MKRRDFLNGAMCAALGQLAACTPVTPTPQPKDPSGSQGGLQTAQVQMVQLAQAIRQQQCPEWCWAACISMMFNFYNHPLSQAEIVAATYGGVLCLPANTTTTIGIDLSRPWIDDRGRSFSSQVVSAYDYFNGIRTFSNQTIVDALVANNPLLYCNTSHAMVVYAVTYIPTAAGPNIVSVNVVDPWPLSPITHPLSGPEMTVAEFGGQMTFLAQVRVF